MRVASVSDIVKPEFLPESGTPQGGVLSPLLANIHLHWFDRAFHGKEGPATWANARLVRYADDFVIVARYIGPQITTWIEEKIEVRLGLEINREKTRTIPNLRADGEKLDFASGRPTALTPSLRYGAACRLAASLRSELGYSLKHAHDQYGRKGRKHLCIEPSAKAQARQREKVRQMLDSNQSHTPLPELIARLNRQIGGWATYFEHGHPRQAYRDLNSHVREKLTKHLQRRSQRSWRPPADQSAYAHLNRMGLIQL